MKLPTIEPLEFTREDLAALLERARQGPLNEADYGKLKAVIDTLGYLTELVADKETTIRHLRQLLLPQFSTEKTRFVVGVKANGSGAEGAAGPQAASEPAEQPEGKAPAAARGVGMDGIQLRPTKGHARCGFHIRN